MCLALAGGSALADPPGAPLADDPPLAWLDDGASASLVLTAIGRDAIVVYELFHGVHRVSWSEGPLPDLSSVIVTPKAPAWALRHARMTSHPSTLLVRLQADGQSWRARTIGVVLEPQVDGGFMLRRLADAQGPEDRDPTRFHNRVNSVVVYDAEVYPTRPGLPREVAEPDDEDTGLLEGGQ